MNRPCKILVGCVVAVLVAGQAVAQSEPPKKEARVTQIIRDVQLLPVGSTPRPAVQDDQVNENTGVRTGDESRSELTFEDLTITRLGANTIFSFRKAGRSGELDSGSILLRVPKNSGGAEFKTNAVTVGITGTTVIFESTRLGNSKLIVLEGGAQLTLRKYPRESVKVPAGKMLSVSAGAVKLPEPEDVDLDQIVKTHPLLTDFPPLPSDDLIRTAIKKQQSGVSGAPVSAGGPVTSGTSTPVPGLTGIRTPTPPPGSPSTSTGTSIITPPPRPTSTPRDFPNRTPTPRPRPSPRAIGPLTATPKPTTTPKLTPRWTLPSSTGNVAGTPVQSGVLKKTIRRPTPTPAIIR